jgi:outer membrane protein, heavy metal efflux system
MYMRMDAGFPQRGFTDDGGVERVRGVFQYAAAGVMLTLPVFNRNQGEILAAQAGQAAAALDLEAVRLRAVTEAAAGRSRVEHATAALNAYDDARTLARRNMTIVDQSYQLGRATLSDVLEQRRRYLDVERQYSSALGELFAARQELAQAAGGAE